MNRRDVLAGLAGAAGGASLWPGEASAGPPAPAPTVKLGQRVGIVCDRTCVEAATAIRAALEAFRYQVDFHRLVQRWQADELFAKRAREYEYLILCCHGTDRGKEGLRIVLEVIEPRADDPELGTLVNYHLTPDTVPKQLLGFKGVFVSLACESGREPLGAAFLKAGCRAYLGPGDYSDMTSGVLSVIGFFYFLNYGDLPPDPQKYTVAEAAEAVRQMDRRAKFGTRVWQLYEPNARSK